MLTCSDCGRAFEDGGLSDGHLTICSLCAMYYPEDDSEYKELEPDRFKHNRKHWYGGGR